MRPPGPPCPSCGYPTDLKLYALGVRVHPCCPLPPREPEPEPLW